MTYKRTGRYNDDVPALEKEIKRVMWSTDEMIDAAHKAAVEKTIERCAQVADAFDSDTVDSREIAAAIRALKDEP